ncbi:MAG TPA: DinB family protein [Candidatus Limnocylindrales bacterium]|nr:DinB family protein [Candidatus Limnocylindrales bacterium]
MSGTGGSVALRLVDADAPADLRRDPLSVIQAIDFRAPERDFWADEAAIRDRFVASWAGLDDAAWGLPGAAPSDAGGPDWSLLDHVAHVVDWQEIGLGYIPLARSTGRWPSDADYDGGDFDTFNEHRRRAYADAAPADLRRRHGELSADLIAALGEVSLATIRSDAAWGWVYNILHGHAIDHLRVLEPWADQLRIRQIENDPFGRDPLPLASDPDGARERFWTDASRIFALFDGTVRDLPPPAWEAEASPRWTIADHVGHLASWFEEARDVIVAHRRTGRWAGLPAEGIDAWNATRVLALRGLSPVALRARFDAGRARLEEAIRAMTDDEWLDAEGFSWAYEDLHGHVRSHLAQIAPVATRSAWPRP